MGALYCGAVYVLPKIAYCLFGGPEGLCSPPSWSLPVVSYAFHLSAIYPNHPVLYCGSRGSSTSSFNILSIIDRPNQGNLPGSAAHPNQVSVSFRNLPDLSFGREELDQME